MNERGTKSPNPAGSALFPSRRLPLKKKIKLFIFIHIRACLHVGGGPQVGEGPQLVEVPRLAVIVRIYT